MMNFIKSIKTALHLLRMAKDLRTIVIETEDHPKDPDLIVLKTQESLGMLVAWAIVRRLDFSEQYMGLAHSQISCSEASYRQAITRWLTCHPR